MAGPYIPSPKAVETCKICGYAAAWLGPCDFNKFCSVDWAKGPNAGINVHYYRCPGCGFIFTSSFDHFTPRDWSAHIYNEGYKLVDPEFDGTRARTFATLIANTFKGFESIRVLDYGGGLGFFAQALAGYGWPHVKTYDPFVPEFAARPSGVVDLVFAAEVLEHSPDPKGTFKEMFTFLHPSSLIIATTQLSPPIHDPSILNWWYVAPRNGHVSIYSQNSLGLLSSQLGMKVISFNQGIHAFWRQRPDWAARVLPP